MGKKVELLNEEWIMESRKQSVPDLIDGIGLDTSSSGSEVCLVLRKASNAGLKTYRTDDVPGLLRAMRSIVSELEKEVLRVARTRE